MSCLFSPNQTVAGDLQWWQVSPTLSQNQTCGTTYLRPDVGGAVMPWLFTAFQIIIHLPVVIVRVARWEDVQTLSIVLAIVNVAIVSQAYASTRLEAEHVLVWSPMTLVLDAGAMLQLVILVRINHPNWKQEFWRSIRSTGKKSSSMGSSEYRIPSHHSPDRGNQNIRLGRVPSIRPAADINGNNIPQNRPPPSRTSSTSSRASSNTIPSPLFVAFVIISSFILFLAIFALQLRGLVAAFISHRAVSDIQASWCSPMFGFMAVAELDLSCTFHAITSDSRKGIGCIQLPGKRQEKWLMVTIIAVLLSVIVEALDFLILWRLQDAKWWVLERRRPWFTMIFGLGVLIGILCIGSSDAYNLPPGISEKVFVIIESSGPSVCTGTLTPAGLRGQFLGWLDGLLEAWGTTYFGLASNK